MGLSLFKSLKFGFLARSFVELEQGLSNFLCKRTSYKYFMPCEQ